MTGQQWDIDCAWDITQLPLRQCWPSHGSSCQARLEGIPSAAKAARGQPRAPIRFAEGDRGVSSSFTWKSSFSQLPRLFFVKYGMSVWLRIFINGTNPILPRSWRSHVGTRTVPCSTVLCLFAHIAEAAAGSGQVLPEPWQRPHQGLGHNSSLC